MDYFRVDIYEKLDRRIPYIVGVDCSTGGNGDSNAVSIINPYTVRPVAEFECNYIGETLFEQFLTELVVRYIPKACLAIERNHVGDSIIDHILNTDSPIATNLYYDKDRDLVQEKMKNVQDVQSILKNRASIKRYYGVYTQSQSREQMMAILSRRVAEFKDDFVTNNIIRDLSRLIRKPSGKIEAGPGFHDDSIMSYLIALYVYYHGDNLAAFGIEKGARDEDLNNDGLKRPEEIDPALVDPTLIEYAKKQEKYELERTKFERDLRKAERESQMRTFRLHNAGLIQHDIFESTPESVIDDYDESGEIDLSIF